MRRIVPACSLLLAALTAFACSSGSSTSPAPAAPSPETEPDPSPESPAPAPETTPTGDAGKDAAPAEAAAAWISGQADKSCAASCKAAGKTCAVACKDHMSCGGHDDVSPPYAGYACYYYEKKDANGSIRLNEGRSFKSCDEVVTRTWDPPFSSNVHTLGSNISVVDPIACCCR